jgi:hypothetical protein
MLKSDRHSTAKKETHRHEAPAGVVVIIQAAADVEPIDFQPARIFRR